MTLPRFLRADLSAIASARPDLIERAVTGINVPPRIRLRDDLILTGRNPLPVPPSPPAAPPPAPAPALPAPPAAMPEGTPFDGLPMPSPGDRIRAEDFRRITQCLQLVQQATLLAATLFGRTLGEARAALQAQGWALDRVVSVFGQEVAATGGHEDRRVVQVVPAALGLNRVHVVVTEALQTQQLAPNLVGLTHAEAMERLRAAVGTVAMPSATSAPALAGLTLGDAARAITATR